MRYFREGFLKGMGIFTGIAVLSALTALAAQTFRTFKAGDLVSASFINDTFQYLRSRIESPLPLVESSSASWSTTSTGWQDVTNLSVSVTSAGSPIWLGLVSDGGGSGSSVGLGDGSRNDCAGEIRILRDGTEIAHYSLRSYGGETPTRPYELLYLPPGFVWHIDNPGSGTYTYSMQARRVGSSGSCSTGFGNVKLQAARFNEL